MVSPHHREVGAARLAAVRARGRSPSGMAAPAAEHSNYPGKTSRTLRTRNGLRAAWQVNPACWNIEDAGDSGLAVGSRVMFTEPYGVRENGAWQEWLLPRPEDLAVAPDAIDGVVAASVPVAYLTAQITLTLAGFKPGMTVLAPAIGGSVREP